MVIFQFTAVLLTLAAVFGYLNHRYLKLPTTIGVMLIGLIFSLSLLLISYFYPGVVEIAREFVQRIDFNKTVLECMLSFLLFAGALHVNLSDLARQKRIIAILATAGVILSTFLVGTIVYYAIGLFGINSIPYIYCLLFGALISPTDPVAVLGILRKLGVPKTLEVKITGESLFNDGVGVVVFLTILGIATGDMQADAAGISLLFIEEVGGGVLLGGLLGVLGFFMLKRIDDYQVEVLITLALVVGGYNLALALHISGPLAMVVAGLLIGNHGRTFAMSDKTREHLDTFWELVDEILNALLFVLIGLEILILKLSWNTILFGLAAIPIVLLARFIAVGIPVTFLKRYREFTPRAITIMTWGGLRGGISVALALAIPAAMPEARETPRDVFLTATYIIVIFSIAMQGLTLKYLIKDTSEVHG